MRAVRLHAFDRPPQVDEIPPPDPPGAGELTIEVAAAGVGAWDVGLATGKLGDLVEADTPFVLGAELAGRVAQVGEGVSGFSAGDRVMANPGIAGAWAERVTIAAERCGRAPAALDDVAAATLPVGMLTAWQSLDLLDLPEGSSLLVLGAGGSVGTAAVQVAVARGLRALAIAGEEDLDLLRRLGAGTALDYRGDWVEALGDVEDGVAGALDLVGGDSLGRSAELLRPGGRVVTTLAEEADRELPGDVTVQYVTMKSDTDTLEAIASLVDDGGIEAAPTTRFTLEQVSRALEHARSGPHKTVLEM